MRIAGRQRTLAVAFAALLLLAAGVLVARQWTTVSAPEPGSLSSTTAEIVGRCAATLPAFPGAEGFGCGSRGGRGGAVRLVTSLSDSGPGTLREALEASGPRFVVFRVAGIIDLSQQIVIDDPYVTVAGQSSPGGGITLRAAAGNTSGLIDVRTHDVVIRFIRFRSGAPVGVSGENLDGLTIWRPDAHDVVVDHNSFSWAVDENVSTWDDARDITFSWNIIAQGLRASTHPEGEHSKGLLVSGARTGNISVHHNLFAHNTARNPQVSSPGAAQIVNNVIYNYGDSALQTSNPYGSPHLDVVGNYFRAGPDTDTDRFEVDAYPIEADGDWSVYVGGNLGPHRESLDVPDSAVMSPEGRRLLVAEPQPDLPKITTTDVEEAREGVLAGAGATLPRRDSVDAQIVDDVRNGRGAMVDQGGPWPSVPPGTAPPDGDNDGMPDEWERAHRLDAGQDDSARIADGRRYTNIEVYVNSLLPDSTQGHD